MRFSLYLEKKHISMICVKLEGLEHIISTTPPNEVVEILQDFFERVEFVSKSTSSLMEPSDNFTISIAFNASKEQSMHEERAVKACVDLSSRLADLQKNKWNQMANSHSLNTCQFRLAIYVQQCLCGNVGTNDKRLFKILENLNI